MHGPAHWGLEKLMGCMVLPHIAAHWLDIWFGDLHFSQHQGHGELVNKLRWHFLDRPTSTCQKQLLNQCFVSHPCSIWGGGGQSVCLSLYIYMPVCLSVCLSLSYLRITGCQWLEKYKATDDRSSWDC